ncbi:MAG: hypothetical protein Q8Q73_08660 [Stagnimonas sp.]|nr:hypothetical protein [Stagnimonas sp.]
MLAYHPDSDANQVLNILDSECRGVVQGIERVVLEFKWRLLGRPDEALARALARLLDDGLLRPVGGLLRLTALGYARLTSPEVDVLSTAAAPDPAVALTPTEYGVREKLLAVFRARGVGPGGRLSVSELSRCWEVARYRATDLRSGLELLMRDGHAKLGRFGQTQVRLENDGHQYLSGLPAPTWMARESVALAAENLCRQSLPDQVLCILAARKFHDASGREQERSLYELDYLLERYELPDFARFHACELLHRLGYAELLAEGPALRLTNSGRALVLLAETSNVVQWSVQQALKALEPKVATA